MKQQNSHLKEFSIDSKLFKESIHERPEVSRNIKPSLKLWNDQRKIPQKYLFYDIHQSLLVFVFKLLHSLLRVLRILLVLLRMLEILMMLMILRVLIGLSVLGMVGLLRMVLLKLGKVLLRILLWLLKVVWMFKLMIGRLLVGSILMFKLLLVGVKRIVQVRLQQLLFIFDQL